LKKCIRLSRRFLFAMVVGKVVVVVVVVVVMVVVVAVVVVFEVVEVALKIPPIFTSRCANGRRAAGSNAARTVPSRAVRWFSATVVAERGDAGDAGDTHKSRAVSRLPASTSSPGTDRPGGEGGNEVGGEKVPARSQAWWSAVE
jgi:hypothetical protein